LFRQLLLSDVSYLTQNQTSAVDQQEGQLYRTNGNYEKNRLL